MTYYKHNILMLWIIIVRTGPDQSVSIDWNENQQMNQSGITPKMGK